MTQRRQKHIYFLGFLLVFAICLVFFENILKNKVKNWIATILMLCYKNLILKNKKNIILKYFKIKKKL